MKLEKIVVLSIVGILLFVPSQILFSNTAQAYNDGLIEYPDETTIYTSAGGTESFEMIGPEFTSTEIWIEDIIINNDDVEKYQPFEDFVYFSYKKDSGINTPVTHSQYYNFKTSQKGGFYKGDPNGILYKRAKLKIVIPEDADRDAEVIVKIKQGDYDFNQGHISFEGKVIVNNNIWE